MFIFMSRSQGGGGYVVLRTVFLASDEPPWNNRTNGIALDLPEGRLSMAHQLRQDLMTLNVLGMGFSNTESHLSDGWPIRVTVKYK